MKMVLKIILWLVIIVAIMFALFLIYITITDFKPDKKELIVQSDNTNLISKDTFSLISWNIGYAGLGAEMDFFYDGGKKVRPTKEMSRKYLDGIKDYLSNNGDIDFWLLQEVDVNARRSHQMNEVDEIKELMNNYFPVFAINYKVSFVPVPVYEPMGKVKGGVLMLSKDSPLVAERHAYPLIASWPNRLFLLDRCFILSRYLLENGKELVVMNTHNSAYVTDSLLREKELAIIRQKMVEEYDKGNYVIVGGDWNANPPFFDVKAGFNGHLFEPSQVKMRPDLLPSGWIWAFDPKAPTNRNNDKAFVKGKNGTSCLDYFVVSPNIGVMKTKTIDLNFENSDHNPVYMEVQLLPHAETVIE